MSVPFLATFCPHFWTFWSRVGVWVWQTLFWTNVDNLTDRRWAHRGPATWASILTNLDHQQIQVAIHKYKSRWQSTNSNTNLDSQRACLLLGPCQAPQLPWMQVGWRTWLTGASLTNLDHQHIHVAIHKFKYKSRWQSTNTSPGDNSQIQIQIEVAIHKYKVMWQSTNTTSEMKNPDVLGQHKICIKGSQQNVTFDYLQIWIVSKSAKYRSLYALTKLLI